MLLNTEYDKKNHLTWQKNRRDNTGKHGIHRVLGRLGVKNFCGAKKHGRVKSDFLKKVR
jgi:hypothetical protein